ncbi:Sb-PDE family phosphodiesterase [Roseivirga sp.]|uniref:Sb-PDE family phosphodiesterase n=1 Tax=Roseivirga sp. TaxID=1964215 RepID=UPI003B516DC7
MKKLTLTLLLLFVTLLGFGQNHNHAFGRKINFPNVEGYVTLKADLHIHTVFSDGSVWPDIRVQEAIRDGLDVISLTEHLEYQPHSADIPHPNRNRSYELAVRLARNSNLMIVRGSEITRSMPPGHSNAIFIEDANPMLKEEAMEAFQEAKNQNAFVFWNHPTWTGQEKDGIAKLYDLHRDLISKGLLHGIEVVNMDTYSEEALKIALDNNLTIMGTSDVHGLIDWDYETQHGGHRPITLVFSKERSIESLQEGLTAGRTVVWYNNLLVGKEENMNLLLDASLKVEKVEYPGNTSIAHVTIKNLSDTEFELRNLTDFSFYDMADLVKIKPQSETVIKVKTKDILSDFDLEFEVMNAVIAPKAHAKLTLHVARTDN